MAPRLLDRVAYPEVRRAGQDNRASVMPRLLQRLEERFALLFVIDHVVLSAPGEEKCRAAVPGGDVGKRRSVEVDAPVVDEARAEKLLDDWVSRARDLVVAPLAREIEDRVDRHAGFHRRRHATVRIARVAFAKQRVLSRERDERGEVPARGIAHEGDALRVALGLSRPAL